MAIASILVVEFQFTQSQIEIELNIVEKAISILAQQITPCLIQNGSVPQNISRQRYFVLKQSPEAFLTFRLLEQLVYPIPIYGAIGLGDIDSISNNQIKGAAWNQAMRVLAEAKTISQTAILYDANFLEDSLLNMQLYSWTRLKEEQSPTARVFSLAYEIQTPMNFGHALLTVDWQSENLNQLEQLKFPLFHGDEKLQNYEQLDFNARKKPKWLEVHQNLNTDHFLIDGLYRRGYATAIAEMAHTTRQNVDYHLKNGNFRLERNLTAAILLQLEREERAIDY